MISKPPTAMRDCAMLILQKTQIDFNKFVSRNFFAVKVNFQFFDYEFCF